MRKRKKEDDHKRRKAQSEMTQVAVADVRATNAATNWEKRRRKYRHGSATKS